MCKIVFLKLVLARILMLGACGGRSSNGSSTSDVLDESLLPLPKPGVAINSIEIDECPNIKVYLSVTDEKGAPIEIELSMRKNRRRCRTLDCE